MADCQCNITNGLLSPGIFNLKQFTNETERMRWTLSSRQLPGGIDLANYDAFLVLQHGQTGEPDEVMLTPFVNNDGTITLVWDIGEHATWLKGYVKYQIVFRGRVVSELSVLCATDDDASGVYRIVNELADGIKRKWVHESRESYTIDFDTKNQRWRLRSGNSEVTYQKVPGNDPHYGLWDNAIVGNVSAITWRSLEAFMYISESIAADISISAKYPTILRQMWHGVRDMIIKSGVTVFDGEVTENDWQGNTAPYCAVATNVIDIPVGCTVADVKLFKTLENGSYSGIDNIRYEQAEDGSIYVFCLEKIAGKLAVTVKGGNGYFIPATE